MLHTSSCCPIQDKQEKRGNLPIIGEHCTEKQFQFFRLSRVNEKAPKTKLKKLRRDVSVSQATDMMLGELLHFGAFSLTCAFIHLLHIQVTY